MIDAQVLILAKEPIAGRVKTRLTPGLTHEQAASVARASLDDTLDAVRRTDLAARVLVADGLLTAEGFTLQAQTGDELDVRLAAAFDDAWATRQLPMLLIGMDTPQLSPALLTTALEALLATDVDAVLGLAHDGGWWCLGLREPHAGLIRGVATSQSDTGSRQRGRLLDAGLNVADLVVLTDVDTVEDLRPVAALAAGGRFAAVVRQVLS